MIQHPDEPLDADYPDGYDDLLIAAEDGVVPAAPLTDPRREQLRRRHLEIVREWDRVIGRKVE
jgi:hypothetical protein